MSLNELIPTLGSIKKLIEDTNEKLCSYKRASEGDGAAFLPRVSYNEKKFLSIATEVDNQIRTANRPFTVAVVGEFKVGKSTFLNGLLGLSGDATLSAADTPDTACSILLRYRTNTDPEARLQFIDSTQPQDVPWVRAKQLTSQVWLDYHHEDQSLAKRLLQVEYFLNVPLLERINLNDLPGTGSRYWREHTTLTHQRMKEADAVIWIIGDEEPSRDSRKDLEILKECSQSVIPVLNVREDPTISPPLLRDQSLEEDIVKIVLKEFRQFFAPSFDEPIRVSARIIEIERAKPMPDALILKDAGFDNLIRVFTEAIVAPAQGQGQGRLNRLCGTTLSLAADAENMLGELKDPMNKALKKMKEQINIGEEKIAELGDIQFEIQSRIRTLARDRADQLVCRVGAQARVFVGDVLQITNFRDMKNVFTKKGRGKLEEDLKKRFLTQYLQLDREDNWLVKFSGEYAEDVRCVVIPIWRRFARSIEREININASAQIEQPDFDRLSDALFQGINSVLLSILGIAGAAALLAAIPGGQIVDAVGIVGLLVLSAISDPLAGARRRAIDRVVWQIESQKFSIADTLKQAAEEGSRQAKEDLNRFIQGEKNAASQAYEYIKETGNIVQSSIDDLGVLIEGLRVLSEGGSSR